jgi:hypothetical protein
MKLKPPITLSFVAACLTFAAMPAHAQMHPGAAVISNAPQRSTPPDWSVQQNVIESQLYEKLLETNRAFRKARLREECGPITDPQLRQSCIASFKQDEPYAGSSSSQQHPRTEDGR